jgi:hypothetical protein
MRHEVDDLAHLLVIAVGHSSMISGYPKSLFEEPTKNDDEEGYVKSINDCDEVLSTTFK